MTTVGVGATSAEAGATTVRPGATTVQALGTRHVVTTGPQDAPAAVTASGARTAVGRGTVSGTAGREAGLTARGDTSVVTAAHGPTATVAATHRAGAQAVIARARTSVRRRGTPQGLPSRRT
ncbi:hypothetical protein V5D56_12900 [Cellulosimicrobium sp. PMB13]|uniref:hypothetical protein n=1 Tax=Cellulosimicrobium sp. PMB13 TaxID=3120158 RepID=UPI003F4B8F3E